ncbi:hypothetical protein [Pengzhenrongella phosphoraccumulans]|uniref:hypothetical protein n=1 Tax=Pengzhenrongella phosphoraccumulans TaxID=3114394 RepID=UPI003890F0F5
MIALRLAVAVIVMPPADADAVTGPTVLGTGSAAHIQTGIPTIPTDPGPAAARCQR